MTPSEKLILKVVRDELAHPERLDTHPRGYGPYGRAKERTGVLASRCAEVELNARLDNDESSR